MARVSKPAPWKPDVQWWLQSRATRNLEGVVTGNTPMLPTPLADHSRGLPSGGKRDFSRSLADVLLPTPAASDSVGARNSTSGRQPDSKHHDGDTLGDLVFDDRLLPTPVAQPSGGTPERHLASKPGRTQVTELSTVVEHLLPTPKASDGPKGGPGMRNGKGDADALPGVVHLLPTPTTMDCREGRDLEGQMEGRDSDPFVRSSEGRHSLGLQEVAQLLPTPTAVDMGRGHTPEEFDGWTQEMRERHGNGNGHGKSLEVEALRLLPTPTASDNRDGQHLRQTTIEGAKRGWFKDVNLNHLVEGDPPLAEEHLLPTPKVAASRASRKALVEQQQWSAPGLEQSLELARGELPREYESADEVHGKSREMLLPTPTSQAAQHGSGLAPYEQELLKDGIDPKTNLWTTVHLLPTPRAAEAQHFGRSALIKPGQQNGLTETVNQQNGAFGPYQAAINRWATIMGRPAPSPTEPGKDGRPRLSARLVEWMMAFPDGWVTDVGLSRSQELRLLGNAVVAPQALLALRLLVGR